MSISTWTWYRKTHFEQRLYLPKNRKASKLVEIRRDANRKNFIISRLGNKERKKKGEKNILKKNQQHDSKRSWSDSRYSKEQQTRSTPEID